MAVLWISCIGAEMELWVLQVSSISINVEPTVDVPASAIAHELVSVLRDSAVEFVGVLGAAHLPAVANGRLYCCSPCSSEGSSPAPSVPELLKGASQLPGSLPASSPKTSDGSQ